MFKNTLATILVAIVTTNIAVANDSDPLSGYKLKRGDTVTYFLLLAPKDLGPSRVTILTSGDTEEETSEEKAEESKPTRPVLTEGGSGMLMDRPNWAEFRTDDGRVYLNVRVQLRDRSSILGWIPEPEKKQPEPPKEQEESPKKKERCPKTGSSKCCCSGSNTVELVAVEPVGMAVASSPVINNTFVFPGGGEATMPALRHYTGPRTTTIDRSFNKNSFNTTTNTTNNVRVLDIPYRGYQPDYCSCPNRARITRRFPGGHYCPNTGAQVWYRWRYHNTWRYHSSWYRR